MESQVGQAQALSLTHTTTEFMDGIPTHVYNNQQKGEKRAFMIGVEVPWIGLLGVVSLDLEATEKWTITPPSSRG